MLRKVKFSLLQACFWCLYASSYSFMVAYLLSEGISVSTAGFAMATSTLCGFFGQFIVGFLCDKLQRSKPVYIFGTIYLLVILYILMSGEKTDSFVIVMMGMFGFLQMPMASVLDSWIMKSFENGTAYGPIRSWGSVAYSLFALVFGGIIESFGYSANLFFSFVFVILNTIFALTLPDTKRTHVSMDLRTVIGQLLKNKNFLTYLLLMFFYGFSIQPLVQMMSVIILDVGGTLATQGIAMFISAAVQVPILMITPKLSFIRPQLRLILGMVFFVISLSMLSFVTTVALVLVAMTINGIGYAVTLSALRENSISMCPPQVKATAVSLVDAFYSSLAGCVGTAVSGVVIEIFSVQTFMMIATAMLMVVAVITAIFFNRMSRGSANPVRLP